LHLAKTWLKDCITTHSICQNHGHASTFRPLRLIDVQQDDPNTIRLDTTTSDEHLQYVALSYCWGGDQLGKTLRANLDTRTEGFSLSDSPATIRDAVSVTRQLGVRFIWIDSLCIVQDDDDDKNIEITRMHDIYQHAAVTLSAARATSSQQGFLNVCSPPLLMEPIHSRAWTMQEHVLSRRLLIFGTFGVRWTCSAGRQLDNTQENGNQINNLIAEFLLGPNSKTQYGESTITPDTWRDTVSNYSVRALTNPEDQLLAISAIATLHAAARPRDRYLAGLWADSVAKGLLWNVRSVEKSSRSQDPQFPSWSWASVRAAVFFAATLSSAEERVTMRLVSYDIILSNKTVPLGHVIRGSLDIEGNLFVIRGAQPDLRFRSDTILLGACEAFDEHVVPFHASLDLLTPLDSLVGLVCLELISTLDDFSNSYGLILCAEAGSTVSFSRVGIFTRFPGPLSDRNPAWKERPSATRKLVRLL
ncbi:HET-domain-containing protein, partial [Cryphonectria parasitica EP155]